MIELKEYKELRSIEELKWFLEELQDFKKRNEMAIIDNLMAVLEHDITHFGKTMHYLWIYNEGKDLWIRAVGSYDKETLEKDIEWVNRDHRYTKYAIIQENLLGNNTFPNEVFEVLTTTISKDINIKEIKK